jgi:hypothetical protein
MSLPEASGRVALYCARAPTPTELATSPPVIESFVHRVIAKQRITPSMAQLLYQRLRLVQVLGVEPFGEPVGGVQQRVAYCLMLTWSLLQVSTVSLPAHVPHSSACSSCRRRSAIHRRASVGASVVR